MSSDLDHVRRAYRRLATSYDRSASRWDRLIGLDAGRRWIATRAHGRLLEVGIGTGLSLPHYPPDVDVAGIDASPEMLDIARRRAHTLGRVVALTLGDAEALPFAGQQFNSVAFTYSLCTIPDPECALREARRVLRRGGSLLLAEHVRSPHVLARSVQRALNPLFERFEADHLLREPLEHVHALGFVVEELERRALGVIERVRATKPS